MTEPAITQGDAPEWTLTDRMRKSLRSAGLTNEVMADYLGVHRTTISPWLSEKTPPSSQTLRLWAIRCGVSYEWLMTGKPASPAAEEASPQLADGVF
jgi:transcriptional regulator with XRE-family HTH domain